MSTDQDDPVRTYSLEEQARLTDQLASITHRVHAGEFRQRPLDERFLQELHESIFRGVRDHAGRMRGRGFGQEYLTFGPNRSAHRNDVGTDLRSIFARAERQLHAIRAHETSATYEFEAIQLAASVHAEVIGVHPFEDGNGRTSRLCASHLLVALGLLAIPVEAVKQEYTAALNVYFRAKDIGPLVDLLIRLYPVDR